MDTKEIMAMIEKKLADENFRKQLMSDPMKAVETTLGITIPAEQKKTITDFVKKQLAGEAGKAVVSSVLGNLLKKDQA